MLEQFEGSGEDRRFVGFVKKWKLSDKKPALDMLMKHLNGYEKDRNAGMDTLAGLLASFQRSAVPVVKDVEDGDA